MTESQHPAHSRPVDGRATRPAVLSAIQTAPLQPPSLAECTLFVLMHGRNQERVRNSALAAFAAESRASLTRRNTRRYSVPSLIPCPRKRKRGCRSAGLRPSHQLREGHASGVQGLVGRSPLHGPVVLGLPGGVRGVWRALSGAAAWA